MINHVVVVLSYFGRQDTIECISSILLGDNGIHPLVVDNGSRDGVVEEVISRWGDSASTLQLDSNLGFTGGMNAGIRWALARDARTITVLNNDTVCRAGALARLADTARSGAAVAPEIRYRADPDRVWFAGGAIDSRTGLAHHLSDSDLALPDREGLRSTTVLTGCCVTALASVWQRVGLFDERFFLNFEDSDWSVRADASGVPLVVDTQAIIEHQVSASFSGAFSHLGLYFFGRNGLAFVRERSGAGPIASLRFIRSHLVPALRASSSTGGVRGAARRAYVLAYVARDVLLRRFGPAPRGLHRQATKWAHSDAQAHGRPADER